jgi:replicative DNA helicase
MQTNDCTLQKLPPQCIEAEESVLSAAMLGSAEDIIELLNPEDFYRTGHQKIFAAITRLQSSGTNVDLTTVVGAIRDAGQLEECGGAAYIARIIDTVPGVGIKDHCDMIKSASQKRMIIKMCSSTIQACYNGDKVDKILERIDMESAKIPVHSGSFYRIGDLLPEMLEKWEAMKNNPNPPGIPCGLSEIDRRFGGFQGSTLYVVAGRPGMGKTAWGMRVARGAAKSGFPSLQISLEMSKEQLTTREVSCESGVDGERFTTGEIQADQWVKIAEASENIHDKPLWTDDTPTSTVKEIQSKIRNFKKMHGRCIILVDYLDYIEGEASERKDLEIGTITKGLKAAAKTNDVPVILFSQLNRKCEERDNKRPVISDLRNSGAIEQDADVVAFLYRDEHYYPDTDRPGVGEFIIRKYRQGKIGTIYLTWIGHRTTYENQERNHTS